MRRGAFTLLWLYVFTLPWDYILQFGDPIGSAGRVAGLLALAGGLLLVVTTGHMRRVQLFHIAALCYLAIVAASFFWTADPDATPHSIRVYIQSVMVIWVMWELGTTRERLVSLCTAYVAGAYVAALSVFHSFSLATVSRGAKEARFSADNWNVNDIALVLSLGIPLAFYIASKRSHWIKIWLALGYLILGPTAIMLTSSRTGIVVMAIAFSALPLFFRRLTLTAKVMTVIVLVVAVCFAVNYVPQQSWDRVSTLFASLRAGDLNSRELTWQSGLRAFSRDYLVGVGAGGFQAGVGSDFTAHNTFLAVLVEQGILGFVVFSVILGCTVRGVRHLSGDDRRLCILLLFCWAVGAFTLGWAMNRVTWFVLAIVVSFAAAELHQPLAELEVEGVVPAVGINS